jgi:hypothetical protein
MYGVGGRKRGSRDGVGGKTEGNAKIKFQAFDLEEGIVRFHANAIRLIRE